MNSLGSRTCVMYYRVSSDEQEREGYSLPAQLNRLREYAARENVCIVEEFVDVESAKGPGRPEFGRMVDFLRKEAKKELDHRCRVLLVEKTDRLYRNLRDYLTLDELALEIHFVIENFVISPDSHSSQKFLHGIKILMAKNYIDNLGEEVRKGMREKAAQGIPANKVPLGYRNVEGPDGKRGVELRPDIAPVIRQLFTEYAGGRRSLADLVEIARQNGLFIGRGTDRVTATLHSMLRNPFYYGEFRFCGKLYRGTYEPIVSRELWDRVQAILKERGTRKPRKVKHSFAFQNLIQCGHCGCSLIGEIKKDRYVYYHCTFYRGKCPERYVREEALEEKFTEILRSLKFDEETLAWVGEALRESHADERRHHEESVSRLQAEYTRLQNRIEAAYEDKLDRRITTEFYDAKVTTWRVDQQTVLAAIQDHHQANQAYLDSGVALLELANRAAELFEKQPPREKRRLLDFVLSNCTWANGHLTPQFRQPFDMIADAAMLCATKKAAGGVPDDLHQSMLPNQDSNHGRGG